METSSARLRKPEKKRKNSQLGTDLFEVLKLQAEPFVSYVLAVDQSTDITDPAEFTMFFSWRRMLPRMIMKIFLVPAN
jgi:hypothetical protein